MFPETLIVTINTHGIVPTNIENNISTPIIKKLQFPINMYKINATTYGVPFMSSLENNEMVFSKLKQTVDKLKLNILTPKEVSLILRKQCEILNSENTQNIINLSNYSDNFNSYANYSDFMFNIIETKIDDEYLEKIFIEFDNEQLEEFDISNSNYFNKITLLNVDDNNLFNIIKLIGYDLNQISLTDLIELLYNMTKMKNLIIIDVTCSNTQDDIRNDRRIRRELIRKQLI